MPVCFADKRVQHHWDLTCEAETILPKPIRPVKRESTLRDVTVSVSGGLEGDLRQERRRGSSPSGTNPVMNPYSAKTPYSRPDTGPPPSTIRSITLSVVKMG